MIAVDASQMLLVSGNGDVIEPDEGVIAIGSGGVAAHAAAVALLKHADAVGLNAVKIVEEAMRIAAAVCVYTNESITLEELEYPVDR